jgi:hypothetical protein
MIGFSRLSSSLLLTARLCSHIRNRAFPSGPALASRNIFGGFENDKQKKSRRDGSRERLR